MRLVCNEQLQDIELHALELLCDACLAHDGGLPVVYWHLLILKRHNGANVLYYEEDQLVGFLSTYFFEQAACEITMLVMPGHRNRGIARQLLSTTLPLFVKKGTKRVVFSKFHGLSLLDEHPQGLRYRYSEYHMERRGLEPIFPPQHTLSFSRAQVTDIPLLCSIDTVCFPAHVTDMEMRFKTILQDTDYLVMVARQGDIIVGKAHIRLDAESVNISDIAVLPAYRRKGVGSEILAYCVNLALKEGKRYMSLDVETVNKDALQMYIRHGFHVINTVDYWEMSVDDLLTHIPRDSKD